MSKANIGRRLRFTRLQVERLERRIVLVNDLPGALPATLWKLTSATGTFSDAANWAGGAPNGSKVAGFSTTATHAVSLSANGLASNLWVAGSSTDVTLNLAGHTLNTGESEVDSGKLTIVDGDWNSNNSDTDIGETEGQTAEVVITSTPLSPHHGIRA